jgi:hypothetical protein
MESFALLLDSLCSYMGSNLGNEIAKTLWQRPQAHDLYVTLCRAVRDQLMLPNCELSSENLLSQLMYIAKTYLIDSIQPLIFMKVETLKDDFPQYFGDRERIIAFFSQIRPDHESVCNVMNFDRRCIAPAPIGNQMSLSHLRAVVRAMNMGELCKFLMLVTRPTMKPNEIIVEVVKNLDCSSDVIPSQSNDHFRPKLNVRVGASFNELQVLIMDQIHNSVLQHIGVRSACFFTPIQADN